LEPQHSAEYRTVAVFASIADAEVVRGVLESDGIAAAVFEGTDAALLPGVDRAVRVLVPSIDLGRARELLATPSEPVFADDSEDVSAPAERRERSLTVVWLALLAAMIVALAATIL
jgi:hypothetical protein